MVDVRLTVLGSADAFNSAGRGHSCYLIEDRLGAFTVDFGPTAMSSLKKLGRHPSDIDAVLVTHLHGDHFGGLQTLFIDAYYQSFRKKPLLVAGPPGTGQRIEELFSLAYASIAARPRPFPLEVVEFRPGEDLHLLGRRLQVFQADHLDPPRDIACVLRIGTAGRTLTFSGDTGWTEQLIPASDGADVFLCECTFFDEPVPQHLSWKELHPRLPQLRTKRLVLTHLSEAMRNHGADVLASAPVELAPVELADDGMSWSW